MLSGIMLIIVTMFAVLGAYYLSEVITAHLFRDKNAHHVAVLVAGESADTMWNSVLDVRARLPHSTVIVVRTAGDEPAVEPSMQDVLFATPQTVGEMVCSQLKREENR